VEERQVITPDDVRAGADLLVYVEDNADTVWRIWFPPEKGVRFVNVGDKAAVKRKGNLSFGVVDRDFDDDEAVQESLAPGSRVCSISRYAVENYLLEPRAIADVVAGLPAVAQSEPQWTDPTYIERAMLDWAYQLRFYAAANYLIDGWNLHIRLLRFFRPGQPDHLFDRDYILQQLRDWVYGLPAAQDVERLVDEQAKRIEQACRTLQGVHRWIDGKAILSSLLHPRVFHAVSLSANDLRRYLAQATHDDLPHDLLAIADRWKR
jgi:hypothetical protein